MKDLPWILQQQPTIGTEAQNEALDWGEKEWGSHRYHISLLVDKSIQQLARPEKAVVLGAGNHGEVNLPHLAAHFQQVTVMDTEDNMIQEWQESVGGWALNRLKSLARVDYTGLDQISFYETFEELMMNGAPASQVAGYLRDCAFQVRRHEVLPHLKGTFSLVISSGVHTQLFYIDALSQFYGYMERYSKEENRQILDAMAYLRNSLVTDYNQLLLSLAKEDGRIAVWTDMILLDENNKWIADELYGLQSERERISFLFEAFGKYGLEAAVHGLRDLHAKLRPEQMMFQSWIGHTETGKTYLVAGLSGLAHA